MRVFDMNSAWESIRENIKTTVKENITGLIIIYSVLMTCAQN